MVTVTVRSFTITTTSSTASNPRAHHAHASANIQARTFISASILLADPESTTLVRLISPARARPSGSGPATTPAPEVRPALGRLRVRQRECRLLRRCLRRRQPRQGRVHFFEGPLARVSLQRIRPPASPTHLSERSTFRMDTPPNFREGGGADPQDQALGKRRRRREEKNRNSKWKH